jgi:hypothetical protein
MRRHAYDEVAVAVSEGAVNIRYPDGTSIVEQQPAGTVRFLPKGTVDAEEGVSEAASRVMVFAMKDAQPSHIAPTPGIPGQFPRVGAALLFETNRVRVWDQTWRPGQRITRHLHYNQTATVFLVGGKMRTIDEGSPPNQPFQRIPGEILYSDTLTPLRVPHEEEQVEGLPRAIWLEFK